MLSVPLNLHFDTSKLDLIHIDTGPYLSADGRPVALTHREDSNGLVVISASRPSGLATAAGSGTVYVLTFRANVRGDSTLTISDAAISNGERQKVSIDHADALLHVR